MATPGEKLAASLQILRDLQEDQSIVAIKSSEINRTHRERLIKNGFLKEVSRGWYIVSNPHEAAGDTTSWYTSYWQFCSRYLKDKYGDAYCISADQSLMIHAGNRTVPTQLIIRALEASNKVIPLLYNTSLLEMKSPLPYMADIVEINGIRMLPLHSALINCSTAMFERNAVDVRAAMALVQDASEILSPLLEGSHTVVAGRLAGAFRNIGRDRIADDILKTMKAADYNVRETDPFQSKSPVALSFRERSPYANRIKLMWDEWRKVVIKYFPNEPGLPKDKEKYLEVVEQIYVTDAYHSLSIERYVVSVELIEKVRTGDWDIKGNENDRNHRNAMAARGYWQATQAVKKSLGKILEGDNAGKVADDDHRDWYQELFAPSVVAGILKASDLAGYRTNQVYISNSLHVPLNRDALRDAMPTLFELLENETSAAVRAVLGHFIFVYIHPYMDGNGRMARFLMNVMLASGGFPWTVIPVEERDPYMAALESASVRGDIEPFTIFLSKLVSESLKGKPVARI
ncbi:Fic family protein [Flavobacterium sp. ZT3R17]|uniref:Fic family protein n=1 Tax=Flavobacterium cryoconiti TaxID=3398736 RepID=UPI003A863A00